MVLLFGYKKSTFPGAMDKFDTTLMKVFSIITLSGPYTAPDKVPFPSEKYRFLLHKTTH